MTNSSTATVLSRQPSPICPYLGLHSDPSVVTDYPTKSHACYNQKQRPTPLLEHQAHYCLANRFGECPFYSPAQPVAQTLAKPVMLLASQPVPAPRAQRYAKIVRQLIFLTLLVLLIDGLFITLNYFRRDFMPQENVPEHNFPSSVDEPAPVITRTAEENNAMTLLPTVTPTPPSMAAGEQTPVASKDGQPLPATNRFNTPTAAHGGAVFYITPASNQVGWWYSEANSTHQIGDSFLYAGTYNEQSYVSVARFDLSMLARGAAIQTATLRLTGLRNINVAENASTRWLVQFIAEEQTPTLSTATYLSIIAAPAAITLLPEIQPAALGVGQANEWQLDQNFRLWLENEINLGATSLTLRLTASSQEPNSLFAWDSGQGSESSGNAPGLLISMGPPPPTPPPLPTRPVIVATLTPVPQNVMTVVAQAATATAQALTIGTPTPYAFEIVTPTPLPENLATVQANALAQGLPAVLLNTPVPANASTATADAAYATAVALTTGTFTPVPTGYVTPVLIYPSPPAENVATAAAQVVLATQAAQSGLPTPTIPWNGVNVIYLYASPTPASVEAAASQIREQNATALTTGTPTPLPWNVVIITPVPPPLPTAIPLIVPADQLEATPTPVPTTAATVNDLAPFRGLVLFLSDRTGQVETWALDPATGKILYLVRDARLHPLARTLYLATSPDGRERAIVEGDHNRDLQIKVESPTYQTTRQLTNFVGATSYDPAWSPLGDRIAFVSTTSGGDEIYTIDPEGNNLTRLTNNSWEWDKHPSWSPDGSQIVFFSNRDSGRKQIWIMNADSSNQRNLSNDEFENWDPVWIR